jgi:penicillin-binding protein 2
MHWHLPVEKAHAIMEKLDKYPYLDVITYSKRNYIYDTFASHTIGYVKPITKKELEELGDKGGEDAVLDFGNVEFYFRIVK